MKLQRAAQLISSTLDLDSLLDPRRQRHRRFHRLRRGLSSGFGTNKQTRWFSMAFEAALFTKRALAFRSVAMAWLAMWLPSGKMRYAPEVALDPLLRCV